MSVVAAVFNDRDTLPALCRGVRKSLGPDCQIILVDDCSSDESAAVMQGLNVEAVRLPVRSGQNAALLEGLRRATGRICCVLDADLEDPPEALPRLIAALDDGVTRVVFSSRDGRRSMSSRLFRRTMTFIFPTLPPRACLCFAMDAAAVAEVVRVASPDDYLVAVIGSLRLPARQVRVTRGGPPTRPSGYGSLGRLLHGARMLAAALRLRWRFRRPQLERTTA